MIGTMAANVFAMEAISEFCSLAADRHDYDIRLEAAIAKLYNSEAGWQIIDDLVQIRGGRGYETADSLRARGEPPIPVERMMRDFRINLIFEGSSEIMHLFIAREAVDSHLRRAGALASPDANVREKAAAALKAGGFYAGWYPARWLGWGRWPRYDEFGALARHVRYVDRAARKLSRTLFHAMVRFGPKLEKRQAVLFRLVDIGAELFAMTAACARAQSLRAGGPEGADATDVADLFCRQARRRVDGLFDRVFSNDDVATYRLAQRVLGDEQLWLEAGMVRELLP
jgi:alkylation response protein AidB-like acyl-CoA dehydrogenase